jgi:hypothetical protein
MKRAPGRPPKQKIFNFSTRAPVAPSSQQLPVVVCPQQVATPAAMLPVVSDVSPPALANPFPNTAAHQRPQRAKKKPDWYGYRE